MRVWELDRFSPGVPRGVWDDAEGLSGEEPDPGVSDFLELDDGADGLATVHEVDQILFPLQRRRQLSFS